jgi:hypothetical protein
MSIPELRGSLPQAGALLDSLQSWLDEGAREWREEVPGSRDAPLNYRDCPAGGCFDQRQ